MSDTPTQRNPVDGWPMFEAFYHEAMMFNIKSALSSIDEVAHAIEELEQGTIDLKEINQHDLLDAIQNIVLQAGMLSRYFWPSWQQELHLKRAALLREKFSLTDESALKDRNLRNYIEHLDEKLDKYLITDISGFIFPSLVTFSSEKNSDAPKHVFRAYYLKEGVFESLGHKYFIQPLIDEIYRIYGLVIKMAPK